jgi:hypothetical protein
MQPPEQQRFPGAAWQSSGKECEDNVRWRQEHVEIKIGVEKKMNEVTQRLVDMLANRTNVKMHDN